METDEQSGANVDSGILKHPEDAPRQDTLASTQTEHHQPSTADTCRKKVLIAIDSSKYSDRALHWYAVKLHTPGDQVLFVNVAEPPELALGFGMAGPAVAEIYTRAIDEAIALAKHLASGVRETCRSLGIEKVRFLERIGHSPGQAIIDVADEEQVDLIVLGSRGVGMLRRTFLGSVSDYVLHHSRRAAIAVVPAHMPCLRCHQPNCIADRACSSSSTKPVDTAAGTATAPQRAECKME